MTTTDPTTAFLDSLNDPAKFRKVEGDDAGAKLYLAADGAAGTRAAVTAQIGANGQPHGDWHIAANGGTAR